MGFDDSDFLFVRKSVLRAVNLACKDSLIDAGKVGGLAFLTKDGRKVRARRRRAKKIYCGLGISYPLPSHDFSVDMDFSHKVFVDNAVLLSDYLAPNLLYYLTNSSSTEEADRVVDFLSSFSSRVSMINKGVSEKYAMAVTLSAVIDFNWSA